MERIKRCLKYVPAEKLSVAPDCGLSQTARWASRQKLTNMVKGAKIVRESLYTMQLIPAIKKMKHCLPKLKVINMMKRIFICGGLGKAVFCCYGKENDFDRSLSFRLSHKKICRYRINLMFA